MSKSRQLEPRPAGETSRLSLRLYVAGQLPNSVEAVTNLRSLCEEQPATTTVVEIVDALKEPDRAMNDRIVATPTLIRLSPAPMVRIFGTLSDMKRVRLALGLPAQNESR